ncbi:hypothetical protein [Hymenobacter jejuensis]|uniref:Uncharacterized protein n=1 Tax=Hymenobacter jejuensis TaxID=2502781 RepID=A0A5B7ZY97_9BACT|nr:hypothetical protein [Hymenobacter jejuensis]QDA59940.1 hypothetical protein FHG12_07365 [Hymenobacter jejuensis]
MAEEYADKMARKTDAELQQYVLGRAQYRDDAVLAALDELTRRGHPHPDTALIRPELEAVVRVQLEKEAELQRQAERVATELEEGETQTGPALYSPLTITLFSVMFSMLAGGALLGINLKVLRQTGALVRLVVFMVLYIVIGAVVLQRMGPTSWFAALFNLPAIIAYNWWFWPRYIRTSTFQSRGWLIPFAVCALLQVGMYMLAAQYLGRMIVANGLSH